MNNYFILRVSILILFLAGVSNWCPAQDSLKKNNAVKKIITKPVAAASTINPATGKPWHYYSKPNNATAGTTPQADSQKTPAVTTTAPVTGAPAAPAPQVDKSLNGQYKYLLTKVYNYQQPFVAALWKNFMDTLSSNRKQLKAANEKLASQGKSISSLKTEVTSAEQNLSESNANADSISFIGVSFSKNSYSLMMWGLVILFAAIAAFVIARSGSNKTEAQYRTKLYNELEEEFKAYKVKANEKEKKLARELQTERNKVDELMGR